MEWIISANSNYYNYESSFLDKGYIDWKQNKYSYALGDIIYIYCTKPLQKIMYLTKIEKIDMTIDEMTDDEEYWNDKEMYRESTQGLYMRLRLIDYKDSEYLSLQNLERKGLNAPPQGAMKLSNKKKLSEYLKENFLRDNEESFETDSNLTEGRKVIKTSTYYERNPIARQKCLDYYGYNCKVCNMNFEEKYGKVGKNFIHVHHRVPLSQRNEVYEVDFIKDLAPVCPNCHAMLHRKNENEFFTIAELKELIN